MTGGDLGQGLGTGIQFCGGNLISICKYLIFFRSRSRSGRRRRSPSYRSVSREREGRRGRDSDGGRGRDNEGGRGRDSEGGRRRDSEGGRDRRERE